MTEVIETAIARGAAVSVFPIHEFWTDIGTPGDLEQALAEFGEKVHS
jgi:NDP-sugar pyrophosphorylase family protein